MTDLNGAVDLQMLRGDNDIAAGFSISNGIYQTEVQIPDGNGGTMPQKITMPVLDLNFHMANGKTTHRISIAPDTVLAIVATVSNWKLSLDQQVAAPPVPPGTQP